MTSHEQRKWLLKLFLGSIHHSFLGEMPGNNFHGFFFFFNSSFSPQSLDEGYAHRQKREREST